MLKIALQRAVEETLGHGERPLIVYGDCFLGIDAFCRQHGIVKISGRNCYEMLLGHLLFESILTEVTGTFFVEQELLLNFDAYCSEPLELTDDGLKKIYFEHYRRLLYVRQPNDVELMEQANIIADFLNLTLEIQDADYSYFSKLLRTLIKCP